MNFDRQSVPQIIVGSIFILLRNWFADGFVRSRARRRLLGIDFRNEQNWRTQMLGAAWLVGVSLIVYGFAHAFGIGP